MEKKLAHGILFYATLYINGILLAIGTLTGRWIFLLLILLSSALAVYMSYLTVNENKHVEKMGEWFGSLLGGVFEKAKSTVKKLSSG
ncbi:hypothetical protein AVEN_34100-1 [Araneus ventricosus]|uniref:Uncharacterized protein n=1 Tax=Araneus ventricosus TaxID=182803 RepID=A0A4Y2W830_ARAVE|nr:hypothetical protein AVEN_34100-1 [Araneus ventricosus]